MDNIVSDLKQSSHHDLFKIFKIIRLNILKWVENFFGIRLICYEILIEFI